MNNFPADLRCKDSEIIWSQQGNDGRELKKPNIVPKAATTKTRRATKCLHMNRTMSSSVPTCPKDIPIPKVRSLPTSISLLSSVPTPLHTPTSSAPYLEKQRKR